MARPSAQLSMRWDPCATMDCAGARVGDTERCLRHLAGGEFDQIVTALVCGSLDARGVALDEELIQRIIACAPVDDVGRIRLRRAQFDGATFDGGTSFARWVFEREVSFDKATFRGDVSFDEAVFETHARFARTAFSGAATFAGADFGGQAWFPAAHFAGEVSFVHATFSGAAWFSGASFDEDVSLAGARFAADASFDRAVFNCHSLFAGTAFHGEVRWSEATFVREARYDGASFLGKGLLPQAAVRQAIWSGPALATWTRRAGAALIDGGIPLVVLAAAWVLAVLLERLQYHGLLTFLLAAAGLGGAAWTMHNLVEQGHSGQTIGKRRLGLCLVGERDALPVGAVRSVSRHALHLIDTVPLGLGWLWPLWDAKRQTFADKLLTTVVVVGTGRGRISDLGSSECASGFG